MTKRTAWDRLMTAFKAKDEAAFEQELMAAKDEMEMPGDKPSVPDIHIHMPADKPAMANADDDTPAAAPDYEARFAKLDQAISDLAASFAKLTAGEADEPVADAVDPDKPDAPNEENPPMMDAATFRTVLAKAEILAPGIKLPTFDAKAKPKAMHDAVCKLRVDALKAAYGKAGKAHIDSVLDGSKADFVAMSCDTAAVVFNAASELARTANNAKAAPASRATSDNFGPMTAARYAEMLKNRPRS